MSVDEGEVLHVPVDELVPFVNQSREQFDEAELLALSQNIKANGQLQPGVACFDAGRSKYILICGERRWRAIMLAGLLTMAVKVIKGTLTAGQMLAINLSENLQRANLNVVERARAFRRLGQLEGITSGQVAERMSVSHATVSRDLSLLDLPEPLLAEIAAGKLPASVGYELSRIDDQQAQIDLAQAVLSGTLSRDGVQHAIRSRVGGKRNVRPKASRLTCRLNGVSVTLSAESPLSWERILETLEAGRRAAKRASEGGHDVTAFGKALSTKG